MQLQEAIDSTKKEWKENPKLKEYENEFISKYGPVFQLENIDSLTSEKFEEFSDKLISILPTKSHLEQLYTAHVIKDMKKLKRLLKVLLDEKNTITERIKEIKTGEDKKGWFNYDIFTAVLYVSNPKEFSIINHAVVKALEKAGIYSNFNDKEMTNLTLLRDHFFKSIYNIMTKHEFVI